MTVTVNDLLSKLMKEPGYSTVLVRIDGKILPVKKILVNAVQDTVILEAKKD